MAETLTLTVALKIPDNEARSALEAIRVKMGYGDRVADLVREEVWELKVEGHGGGAVGSEPAGTARGAIERIVATTNLFANPNKHRSSLAECGIDELPIEPDEVAILVSDREGTLGDAMAAAVRRLGVSELTGARRWVRWRLRLTEPPSRNDLDLSSFVKDLAVADARDGGLLCNPHIQEARAIPPWGGENLLAG